MKPGMVAPSAPQRHTLASFVQEAQPPWRRWSQPGCSPSFVLEEGTGLQVFYKPTGCVLGGSWACFPFGARPLLDFVALTASSKLFKHP
jgi:hypothetical protein